MSHTAIRIKTTAGKKMADNFAELPSESNQCKIYSATSPEI